MKIVPVVILFLVGSVNAQLLSLEELNKKEVFFSKSEAIRNMHQVYRLNLGDYDGDKDGVFLSNFTNCQALDLSHSQNIKSVPIGISKMKNLQFLNLSNSAVDIIYPHVKNLKYVKIICVSNTNVSTEEVEKLKELGITVVEEESKLPEIFKNQPPPPIVQDKNTSNSTNSLTKYFSIKELDGKNLESILWLQIGNNEISALKEIAYKMPNLKYLYIGSKSQDLKEIPLEISEFKNLKTLSVTSNSKTVISKLSLDKLDTLILPDAEIYPDWIANNKLIYLELASSDKNIPAIVFKIKTLKTLVFSKSSSSNNAKGLTNLFGIQNLDNLEKLSVSTWYYKDPNNSLSGFSETVQVSSELCALKKLKHLIIQPTPINELPGCIQNLTGLKTLKVNVRNYPENFTNLDKIEVLSNHFAEGAKVQNIISGNTNLKEIELTLNENSIDLSNHSKLEKLNVHFISPKAEGRVIVNSSKLKYVEIKSLSATKPFDFNFSNCPNIQHLDISLKGSNSIFPVGITNLKDLKEFHLVGFDLSSGLPTELMKHANTLVNLSLTDSKMKYLDPKIEQFTKLTSLNLSNNSLSDVPESIFNLKNCKNINLTGNPISKQRNTEIQNKLKLM
jgi:Leucine-rich repeat (LRR) protein